MRYEHYVIEKKRDWLLTAGDLDHMNTQNGWELVSTHITRGLECVQYIFRRPKGWTYENI